RALELAPRNPAALRAVAGFDLNSGDYQAMFDKLTLAREIDPLNQNSLASLLQSQIYVGQPEAALATARELEAMEPDDYGHIQAITLAYLANNDEAGARRALATMAPGLPSTQLVTYFA